jgi:hypothetical protein
MLIDVACAIVAPTCQRHDVFRTLDSDIQRDLQPEMIETFHFDIGRGKLKIELAPDAVHVPNLQALVEHLI